MTLKIEKVAVLGTGVMGGQIAAHLSNAGIPSYAFDMTQEIAEKGIAASTSLKPSPYYNPKTVELVTPCNYDDHLDKIAEADWVIEVIAERLDWKHGLYKKIIPKMKKSAILTSNTSGLQVSDLVAEMPDDVQKRFFITHFFNPPRYMKLVELVPGEKSDPAVMKSMAGFLEDVLGKGVVWAKDTPNFVANRIGVYGMMLTLKLAQQKRLSVPEVDALTGTIIGHPKSATFRTADVVGLDTLAFVSNTAYEKCTDDEERELFKVPPYLMQMIENKWLGQKTKKGFYHKVDKKTILALNLESMAFEPQQKRKFDAVRVAKGEMYLPGKLKALIKNDDVAGTFLWQLISGILRYSANRIPEAADDIVNIDNAMRWGFGWELGPFETWDALGVAETVKRMKSEGQKVPEWVQEMLKKGVDSFYCYDGKQKTFYDVNAGKMMSVPTHALSTDFQLIKRSGGLIKKSWSASLLDLGEGIAAVETHSILQPTMNPIDGSIIQMYADAVDWVTENGFKGLVIATEATHFSAGANLNMILEAAQREDWEAIEQMSKAMQDALQKLRFAPFPVVAAPHGMALGGGYETIGAVDRIVAAAELYTGLVEVGVGLIPGGGGNLRMLLKLSDKLAKARTGPFPIAQKAFEVVGFARVSSSAKEAVALGYLTKTDKIVVNGDHHVAVAKREALAMAEGYVAPEMRADIILPGPGGYLAFEGTIMNMVKAHQISPHDAKIAGKLAYVLTGGEKGGPLSPVDEQYLLDLEREAFVSLVGEPKSQDRIAFMLKKGKPLRN
ncbi:MAG: 3-hydroxyacyl-CoA dehydrogenase/enoyl-CoA hydratase family protein [Lentisphaeria bacterium]|nr:3-hydroxyacyl-CoA dehydrogenase/enoyl-CoA hydratase family protein [Candidatus Neomarinimicrobiota bacterium]MCF7841611.1 3-hydroxyacyl-CoA dehydrogenase/enoyl-CoA hydratase family protein [Lentisphaeria bacterium]